MKMLRVVVFLQWAVPLVLCEKNEKISTTCSGMEDLKSEMAAIHEQLTEVRLQVRDMASEKKKLEEQISAMQHYIRMLKTEKSQDSDLSTWATKNLKMVQTYDYKTLFASLANTASQTITVGAKTASVYATQLGEHAEPARQYCAAELQDSSLKLSAWAKKQSESLQAYDYESLFSGIAETASETFTAGAQTASVFATTLAERSEPARQYYAEELGKFANVVVDAVMRAATEKEITEEEKTTTTTM